MEKWTSLLALLWLSRVSSDEPQCRTISTVDSHRACENNPACGWNHSPDGWVGEESVFMSNLGAPCVFPYVYKNVTYHHCSTIDHHRPWCATVADYRPNQGLWGNCDVPSCSTVEKSGRGGVLQTSLLFPCSRLKGCCRQGFTQDHYYSLPANYTATYSITTKHAVDLEPVMRTLKHSFLFSLSLSFNPSRQRRLASAFRRTFLADLEPSWLGLMVRDQRVATIDCDGIVTTGDRNLHNHSGIAEEYCHSSGYRSTGCRVPIGFGHP